VKAALHGTRLAASRAESYALAGLCNFVEEHPRLFVLSGAGVSAGSGIPGYRDSDGRWQRTPPVLLQDFLRSEPVRRRYWARSLVGWPVVAGASPNAAHHALARLETAGRLQQLVTQNVDGLHLRAGNSKVIELHGNLDRVVCLDCGRGYQRASIQETLEAENPGFVNALPAAAADGDADIECRDLDAFRVPSCTCCGGTLKPGVVFFGESVPRDRVDAAMTSLEQADAVLVIGSSLMVYSGFRFCARAAERRKPIAAINLGRSRADHLFVLKVERPCADALTSLVGQLSISYRACRAAHAITIEGRP
jgi:NAD-dependent SIR2 family protein deacetylase